LFKVQIKDFVQINDASPCFRRTAYFTDHWIQNNEIMVNDAWLAKPPFIFKTTPGITVSGCLWWGGGELCKSPIQRKFVAGLKQRTIWSNSGVQE
jgi:hypothetical protein